MNKVTIEQTSSSPAVVLDPAAGTALVSGHSFPENTFQFYQPIMEWITEFLETTQEPFVLQCELVYFNTSTAKILFNLFELLEHASENGRDVKIQWLYHPENDVALMCGEEFSDDLQAVPFEIIELTQSE